MIFPYFQIDFVAHDDIPYSSAGSDDVYKHIKEAGEWIDVHNSPCDVHSLRAVTEIQPHRCFAEKVYTLSL